MRLIPSFNGQDIFKVQIDCAIDYEQNPVHYNSQTGTSGDCGHLIKTILLMDVEGCHTWCNMESCVRDTDLFRKHTKLFVCCIKCAHMYNFYMHMEQLN